MPKAITNELVPVLIPKPSQVERHDMILYYAYYLEHKTQLEKELLEYREVHLYWSELFKNIPKEAQEEQGRISDELQKNAIFDNDWEPYVTHLVQQSFGYATMGVSLHSLFELMSMHQRNLSLLLIKNQPKMSIHIINGVNNFVNITMSIASETYLAQKKSIAEKQKKEQELLNNELEQFLYIATHDLQEPLRNVTSYIELLKKKYTSQLDKTGNTYLSYIDTSVSLMMDLVKGLMDYSVIGIEKQTETINCNSLVKNVISNLQSTITDKKVKIDVAELPTIKAYPNELSLLFQNLLSNAIKFSREGVHPHITISAKKMKSFWQFSVKDNGLGIDEKYFEKIFVIFQRLHPRNKFAGTGIGLAHCKKIVELHHGKIWVESTLGEGSTFYFTINENSVK